jgi:DNA topoisomerase III
MIKKVEKDMGDLLKNLERLAHGKSELVLWLDCDREGEAIAFEVIDVIRQVNPRIAISRARFAAVTRADVLRAYENLVEPNQREADAVNYRIEMDFRMGCAFTRIQTLAFSKGFRAKDHMVISYGPCQFPTLGFVVDRYLEIKYFKPEKYWVIKASIILSEKAQVELRWERTSTRDQTQANVSFYTMFESAHQGEGRIVGHV